MPRHTVTAFRPKGRAAALVIPVWNEGHRLLSQLNRLKPHLPDVDVLVADGDSDDGSTLDDRLDRLGVRACLRTSERGLGTALRLGLSYALQEGYEKILTVDGNGKDGLEAIPRFLEALDSADFVQGSRFLEGGESSNLPLERELGIRCLLRPLLRLASGFRYTDPSNGFKGFRREVLLCPELLPFRRVFVHFNFQFYLNYRLPRLGLRVAEVPVRRHYPKGRTPTKITGLAPRLRLLWDLVRTCTGAYDAV